MDGGSLNITDISNNALAAGAITTAGAMAQQLTP